MKKKAGNLLMCLGAVAVLLALLLFAYNQWEAKQAENRSMQVAMQLKKEIMESESTDTPDEPEQAQPIMIDGNAYIGYLVIPAIDLTLPVMEEWSYEGLKTAPGRYSGSLESDDLVIAGHNYARHFSLIKCLEMDTEVEFIDTENRIHRYRVSALETLQPERVDEMITPDATWNLTLFTCTKGGGARCTVRCLAEE